MGLSYYLWSAYSLLHLIFIIMEGLDPDVLQAIYVLISFFIGLFINPKKKKTGD